MSQQYFAAVFSQARIAEATGKATQARVADELVAERRRRVRHRRWFRLAARTHSVITIPEQRPIPDTRSDAIAQPIDA